MAKAVSNNSPKRLQHHSLLIAGLLALALVMTISLSAGMGYLKIAWVDVLRVVGGSLTGNAALTADLDELTDRIPLGWQQLRLLDDVLIVQAEEALDSARAGYVAGALNALDLLDAEHVLFGARTAVARAAADYAIYLARLEGVVAEPLEEPRS